MREMVTVLLPENTSSKDCFNDCPDGALFAASWLSEEDLTDKEFMADEGTAGAWAIMRAVAEGRDKVR